MITAEKVSIPGEFAADSRVWIYQSDRSFTGPEAAAIRALLASFIAGWDSHGHRVKGYAGLLYNQFVVLVADETATGVSGCSTDSSVRLIRQLEDRTSARMFDRLNLAFLVDGEVLLVPMAQLSAALRAGTVTGETPYFNNTVQTKEEFESNWLIPLKQ
ncbi:MAG TPA: hypothetical protein VGR89_12515, partial [Puia sp.]|nr:hypothetical protein [Puia sp.]